jgi:hypothetical protein
MNFEENLSTVFDGNDAKLQAYAYMSGTASVTSTVPSIVESTSFTPANADKEYVLEMRKVTGVAAITISVMGSTVRKA